MLSTSEPNILRPVVAQSVNGPDVFDDEEGDPLPLVNVADVDASRDDGDSVDDKECNIKLRLVTRRLFVVGNVEQEFFEAHVSYISRPTMHERYE